MQLCNEAAINLRADPMSTRCNSKPIVFQVHERREELPSSDGWRLSSDGGALLLQEADNMFGIAGRRYYM